MPDRSDMLPDTVTVERVIPAEPRAVFDVLADPRRHPDIDGSGSLLGIEGEAPARLHHHAVFRMGMKRGKQGKRYSMVNTVVEFEEDRRIAWAPKPSGDGLLTRLVGRVWRYELEPVAEGTRVRETWDFSKEGLRPLRFLLRRYSARARESMDKSLALLEDAATAP